MKWARKNEEQRQYWQTVPLRAYAWVVLSGSLIFFSVGLSSDPALQFPIWWVAGKAAFWGLVIALGAAAVRRNPKMRFVVLPLVVLLLLVLQKFQPDLPLNKTLLGPDFRDVRSRLGIYLFLSSSAAVMAYVTLMAFMGTQGVRLVRARTELELAEKLQQTLAPPLAVSNARYEIQGRSVPSSQMGGDLLDAVDDHGTMACYVADVAGHGIQAGVFMGMVKSSARTALLRPGLLAGFLADLNRVLFDLKAGSATYATFACVRCGEGGQVEYSLAGNGPILHYRAQSQTTSELAMEQFPLGLFANATFLSGSVEVDPGDILVLLTDGLPEVTDGNDEQFGMERIGKIVAQNARGSLAELTETLFAAVRAHGPQTDDETLVLVRASG
jgi:phosphoserine phosphatase RsbU/P